MRLQLLFHNNTRSLVKTSTSLQHDRHEVFGIGSLKWDIKLECSFPHNILNISYIQTLLCVLQTQQQGEQPKYLLSKPWGRRDGTGCSCRVPGFNSQHSHCGPQLSTTPVQSQGIPHPFLASRSLHRCSLQANIHIHLKNKIKDKNLNLYSKRR